MGKKYGICVEEALWYGEHGNKESDQSLTMTIPQNYWEEAARMCEWIPGHVQVYIMVDWGEGSQNLGVTWYNGFKHVATGGSGGFNVYFKGDLDSLERDTFWALKKACAGKTEDRQRTFLLLVYTVTEVQEILSKRQDKEKFVDVIRRLEEEQSEEDTEEEEEE